jgi:hypothetical protein
VAADDIDPEELDEVEIDADDLAPDELEEDELEEGEFGIIDEDDVDGDIVDDDDDDSVGATVVRRANDDDEDEEDLLTADDVEEDLDKILKDKLATEELAPEDEEEAEVDDRTGADDRLQPKRADEQLCTSCFLLVRESAPVCPVGDDACPIFSRR